MTPAGMALLAVVGLAPAPPGVEGPRGFADRIASLRVAEGPYAGGFRQQANDGRLNWYFANLGLLAVADERPDLVGPYLDLYLAHVDPRTGTIRDVADLGTGALRRSDSDDSYAATLLSLAARHRDSPGGARWFAAHRDRLKAIARPVLLEHRKPSGLVPSFANPDPGTPAYLMDNCEVYRGLADFAEALKAVGDPDARTFADAASGVARGVAGLFDEAAGAFRCADVPAASTFYPLRAAQVFPEVFGVPLGDASRTRALYARGWEALNATGDRWEDGRAADGSLGGYPWLVLGYAAALRGEAPRARAPLDRLRRGLARPDPPPPFTAIHELGWAARIERRMGR